MLIPSALAFTHLALFGAGQQATLPLLEIVERQAVQRDSSWLIRYHLAYRGNQRVVLSRPEVRVLYQAWVANSRCRPHTVARRSFAELNLHDGNRVSATVLASPKARARCREWVSVFLSKGPEPIRDPAQNAQRWVTMELAPGEQLWLYLLLEHDHFLHGTYDPLLGQRDIEIRLGPLRVSDSVRLDTEQAVVLPEVKLSAPAKERLDTAQFHSPPDSLYLAADVPGYQYFRYDDVPVRYSTSFRLSFWYLVALGSEGDCRIRVIEYQDTPSAWYRLEGGGFDESLQAEGRWERFEHTFRTLSETTTMAVDFRITGANVGELWIDDVQLVALQGNTDEP